MFLLLLLLLLFFFAFIGEILSHYCFKYSFFLSSPSGTPIMCMLHLLELSHSSWIVPFFFFQFLFSLLFSCWGFYWDTLKPKDSFLNCLQSTKKPGRSILHFCYSVFWSQVFFLGLRISISLTLPISSCMASTYPLELLTY